jgi:hypothetical protein
MKILPTEFRVLGGMWCGDVVALNQPDTGLWELATPFREAKVINDMLGGKVKNTTPTQADLTLNIVEQVILSGYIDRVACSLYFDDIQDNTGSVLLVAST